MELLPENIYHIYNRGNNKQVIFFNRENYLFFLRKTKKHLKPHINFLSYCLMPNHFHFLVHMLPDFNSRQFSEGFKVLLSSYAKAVNIQEQRTGSLFQQNSKVKCLTKENDIASAYPQICFNYIHRNPLTNGLANKMEDWEFSSFKDYIGQRNGTLCNQKLSFELLGLPCDSKEFYEMSYSMINSNEMQNIF